MYNIKAGIFAAGKGNRLKKYFPGIPKPLVKINNKTLVEIVIENYLKNNINDITLLLNTETGPLIYEYLKNKKYSIKFIMIDSKTSFESFYTLANVITEKNKLTVLSTTDTITTYTEIKKLIDTHKKYNAYITLGITELINDEKPLLVKINDERIISIGNGGRHATCGLYVLSPQAVNDIKLKKYNALREFLSSIDFNYRKVLYYVIKESFDIDDINDVTEAQKKLNKLS